MAKAAGSFVGSVESVEARRLFAFVAVGTPGVLQTGGVTAVESAAARPDINAGYRVASWINANGSGATDAVTGTDSMTPVQPAFPIPNSVNSTISNTDVASNTANVNRFVVVWQETKTNPVTNVVGNTVYAQIYNNNIPVGGVLTVDPATAGGQTNCRVAMDGAGNFIVVWEGTSGGATQVSARRFLSDGSARGAAVQISGNATPNPFGNGLEPDVAMNGNGAYAIVYVNNAQTIEQAFDAGGQGIGTANVVTAQTFTEPAIGIDTQGNVTVAWSATNGGLQTIDFRQYDTLGLSTGGPVVASDNTSHNQTVPELAVDTAGGFALGWAEASSGASFDTIAVRVFDRTATPLDTEAVIGGVQFGTDFRFGLAHRLANQFHVAYALGGDALMQTFAQNNTGGGEIPPAADSAFIDLTATPGAVVEVFQTSSQFKVYVNGVLTNFSRSTYNTIYVKGSVGNDYIRMNDGVTVPTTIYGEDGDDTIKGSAGIDLIDAGAGNDNVQGNDGDDYILGGDGDDTLFGGGGNERIVGGGGRNVIYGENGNDTLVGGTAGEAFYGGAGNDSIQANGGGDYVDGGSGNDTIFGGTGDDVLFGNTGNDYIEGEDGNDSIHGGRGNDSLYGGPGSDTMAGDANADFMNGGDEAIGFGGGFGRRGVNPSANYAYFDTLDTIQHFTFRIQVI